jgi:hypothetical protein
MNNPEFRQVLLADHARQIELDLRRARARRPEATGATVPEVSVALRLCTVHDDDALERLAQLEGRRLPRGRFIVAEVDGVVVAAQPLAGGAPLADPFWATAPLLPLLRLRARQLTQPERRRGLLPRSWSLVRD